MAFFYIGSENTPVDNIPWEDPEDTSLIKATRNVLLALLKSSMVADRFQDRGDCYVIRLFGINGDDRILELQRPGVSS